MSNYDSFMKNIKEGKDPRETLGITQNDVLQFIQEHTKRWQEITQYMEVKYGKPNNLSTATRLNEEIRNARTKATEQVKQNLRPSDDELLSEHDKSLIEKRLAEMEQEMETMRKLLAMKTTL